MPTSAPSIVYMGTPQFAVAPLRALVEAGLHVAAVVTVPDKPVGRGQRIQPSAVKVAAQELRLPVLQPERLRDPLFAEQLRSLKPDLGIVVAFRMLPESIWALPRLGTFNLHASLLPQYRGAAPINWAIINGEKQTGVTTFLLNHQIDTGSIIEQHHVNIDPTDTAGSLHDKLMLAGAPLVVSTAQQLLNGTAIPHAQQTPAQGQMLNAAPKIFADTCNVNWDSDLHQLHNLIRGLSPYPAAHTQLQLSRNGQTSTIGLKLLQSHPEEATHSATPGSVSTDGRRTLRVACLGGYLHIDQLQPAGKKAMTAEEYLRGMQNAQLLQMGNFDE